MNELFQWIVNVLKDARFWAIVLPWERAVRVRFGRWSKIWEPGIHLRVPFFDEVRTVNTRQRVAIVPSVTITSRDGRTITVAGTLGFCVVDPLGAMLRMQRPEDVLSAYCQAEFARQIKTSTRETLVVEKVEEGALQGVHDFAGPAFRIDFIRITEFAAVRTYRLLQEQWRPSTGHGDTL